MDFLAERAPFWIAGPLLGLCIIGLRWSANLHLGTTGALVSLGELVRRPREPADWRVFLLVGLLIGGLLSTLAAGGPEATLALGAFDARFGESLAVKVPILLAGGLVAGYGARMSGGCTSGHGICGTALGQQASFVATATFMAVAMGVAQLSWLVFPPGGAN